MNTEPSPPTTTINLPEEADSLALGAALARAVIIMRHGLTIHLSGDLGTGKTTVVRALLRALGVSGRIKSPTYTLVEPYEVHWPEAGPEAAPEASPEAAPDGASLEIRQNLSLYCYHFDFYRFADPREWLEAGFREYFDGSALCLVEWPEKAQAGGHLPPPDLHVQLAVSGDGRQAVLVSHSERGAQCLSLIPTPAGAGFSRPA